MHIAPRGRSGITLIEILISIMIMGIGLVSLATLFPLGLLRLRTAARDTRSTILTDSSRREMPARELFESDWYTFPQSWYYNPVGTLTNYDPWVADPYFPDLTTVPVTAPTGFPGLPVAYDPLYWSNIDYSSGINPGPNSTLPSSGSPSSSTRLTTSRDAARFGSGMGFIRPDPGGGAPSAFGLQRITNFLPAQPNGVDDNGVYGADDDFERYWPFTYPTTSAPAAPDVPGEIFASPDDLVFQKEGASSVAVGSPWVTGTGSPLVPDLSAGSTATRPGSVMRDYAYSWMFTGYQQSAGNMSRLVGWVVVFHNRPFGLDPAPSAPFANPVVAQTMVPTGERVVEAAWGWSQKVYVGAGSVGYSQGDDRVVLLRWPESTPDPVVTHGSWIADVTYERRDGVARSRFKPVLPPAFAAIGGGLPDNLTAYYPAQRCYWYQVAKRSEVRPGRSFNGDPSGVGFREMHVTLNTPVQAKTLLAGDGTGSPMHVNVALIAPSVVRAFYGIYPTK